jgi:hypothetical protein
MRSTDGAEKAKAKKRQVAASGKSQAEGKEQPKDGGNSTKSTPVRNGLSSQQRRLLENQQAILQRIRQQKLVGTIYEPSVQISPAKAQEIARKVGIWDADGKLTSTYKK